MYLNHYNNNKHMSAPQSNDIKFHTKRQAAENWVTSWKQVDYGSGKSYSMIWTKITKTKTRGKISSFTRNSEQLQT